MFPQECPTLFSLRLDRLLKLSETLGRKKRYRGRKEKEIEGKGGWRRDRERERKG